MSSDNKVEPAISKLPRIERSSSEALKHSERRRINWAFFGSSNFSVIVLNKLESLGLVPQLIVTTPDKPSGRGLKVESGPVKSWAEERNIAVFAPSSLKNSETVAPINELGPWDVFLVASYGKIVPKEIFDLPKMGTLNIHPSLLPKFRGPTPLESAILEADETGVTIMKIDEQVDHGEIVAQKAVPIDWPPYYRDLEKILAEEGGKLFAESLPKYIDGTLRPKDQDHSQATFTKKVVKYDLLLDLSGNAETNLRKIRAFAQNRGAYFMQNDKRVIITKAKTTNGKLDIERVKREGKKEMAYEDFKRGLR